MYSLITAVVVRSHRENDSESYPSKPNVYSVKLFRLIWHRKEFGLVSNHPENYDYNPNLVQFNSCFPIKDMHTAPPQKWPS